MHFHVPKPWSRRAPDMPPILPEEHWLDRRKLLKAMGYGGLLGAALPAIGACDAGAPRAQESAVDLGDTRSTWPKQERWVPSYRPVGGAERYPAERHPDFPNGGRPLTDEGLAATHNNFYEFLPGRAGDLTKLTKDFEARPWSLEIAGLVAEPKTIDVDEIARIAPLEERVYRFRCVETWSMVVPWTGIPLAEFVRWCAPKPEARYLRFTTFDRPAQAPGMVKAAHYPWPYYEGLRMDEATNPLALLVTGIYGHALPIQHGAPVRVIAPWKYGYKSPKSIVKVEFVREEPGTFWSDLQPAEYPFLSNVDPSVPHPRWSQAMEKDLGSDAKHPTRLYNGYEEHVAQLYR